MALFGREKSLSFFTAIEFAARNDHIEIAKLLYRHNNVKYFLFRIFL